MNYGSMFHRKTREMLNKYEFFYSFYTKSVNYMKQLEGAIQITVPNYIKLMDFKGLQSAFGVFAYSCLVFSCKMK